MTNPGQQDLGSSRANDLDRAARQISGRLSALGISLDGSETADQITQIADAVEAFEDAVEAHGGDLMVDEPPVGSEGQADGPDFVLPRRAADETVAAYVERLGRATERISDE